MTLLALLISFTSVAIACGLAVVVSRMRRDEQRRSAARVAALSQLADLDFLPEPEPAATSLETAALVETTEHRSAWVAGLGIAGVVAVVMLVTFGAARWRSWAAPDNAAAASVGAASAPLELLALDHSGTDDSLTVSGSVRNPGGAPPLVSLTATVFLFAPDGSFLTSGRTPLDAPLQPGRQSAFSVTIPVTGPVARYRVSFRDAAGRALAHSDLRQGALARSQPEPRP